MELYTLNSEFQRQTPIDEVISVIWTERFTQAGDVLLVVEPSPKIIAALSEGTFLQRLGSDEVMLLDTALIENNQLKVTGKTLVAFTEERILFTPEDPEIHIWYLEGTPGVNISELVNEFLVEGGDYAVNSDLLYGARQVIPGLSMGDIDSSGVPTPMDVPFGQIYTAMTQIAETYNVGISLYLDAVTEDNFSLKFKTYAGADRTSEQDVNPIVRFSPDLDSLSGLKDLRSISGYKTIAYAYSSNKLTDFTGPPTSMPPGIAIASDDLPSETPLGFASRIMMFYGNEVPVEIHGGNYSIVQELLYRQARDALANNNFIRVVDGELTPQSQFKYGIDYFLGDIVELEGYSGLRQRARITEYIRSEDATGEKAYPTVSIVD